MMSTQKQKHAAHHFTPPTVKASDLSERLRLALDAQSLMRQV
jgi:hypothetical protein